MRFTLAISLLGLCAAQAHASVGDYCAAYARDFADKVEQQDAQWQQRYDNAEKTCKFRFTTDVQPVVKSKPKPKLAIANKPAVAAPQVQKSKPVIVVEQPEQQVAKVKPQLVAGSPEWTDYCKKKYVSFNEAKGTYLSKTGIERKCLVTAE